MQAQMLIALSAGSLGGLLTRAKDPLSLADLPVHAAEALGFRGINLPTDLLAGSTPAALDRLRDRADQAHCPVLMLLETRPLDLAGSDAAQTAAMERLRRLAAASSRLGSPRVGVRLLDVDSPERMERACKGIRAALAEMDRWEVDLLLQPDGGLLERGDPLVDLVKKVGGFRIGVLPSFRHAHESGDLRDMLRRLAPYASAMIAQVKGFNTAGKHQEWSLDACVEVLRTVGYGNMLSLEYVGKGDGLKSLLRARDALQEAIARLASDELDPGELEPEEEAA